MRRTLLIAAVAGVAAPGSARAGGFAVSEQSAVAGGSGGASTARSDDAGAAWYNPAALADGGGLRIGAGLFAALASVSAEGLGGEWSAETERGLKMPATVQASFASGRWVAGLSVGVPFGSGVSWPEDWPGRHEIRASRIAVIRAAPFFGWRFGRLRLAAGIHVDAASLDIVRGLDFIDAEGDVDIDLDGWGIGVHAAAFAALGSGIDLGLTYKSRTSLDLDGVADFEAPAAFSMKAADQRAGAAVTLPDRISLGARWQRGELAVLGDLELTLWGVNRELVVDFERDQTPDARQSNDWSATLALRAGAEWQAGPTTLLRGGAFFDPTPIGAETLAPSSPDGNRVGASLGVSQRLPGALHVDGFYTHLRVIGRASASMESLSARYSGSAHFAGIGLRWQPD